MRGRGGDVCAAIQLCISDRGLLLSGFVLLPGAVADSFPLPVESLKVVNTLIFPSLWGLSVISWAVEFIVCETIFLCSE